VDKGNQSNEQLKYIEALSWEAAVKILLDLCKDGVIAERISAMAKTSLAEVDADVIADEVFRSLNSIQVEDLWNNSGKTFGGYNEPTEVAFEMLEDEVRYYVRKMEQYNGLCMKAEEKEYCKGIISGLLKYGQDGNNEFHDWCPDDTYTIAENIIYDWKNNHTAEEIEELQTVYDSFFSGDSHEDDKIIWDLLEGD